VVMTNLVTKLLGPPEEAGACSRLPAQLHRWLIFGNQHFKVYLHHSSQADLTTDLRPYPERLISIGLAKSSAEHSGEVRGTSPDRAAWMVLIAKSAHGPLRVAGDCSPASAAGEEEAVTSDRAR
jgi:hypothetical protein